MIRILLMLVTLMSFSVMAQMTETKTIDLTCKSYVSRLCPEEGCKSFGKEEIIELGLAGDTNFTIARKKFEMESGDFTYFYEMDIGRGLEFVPENQNKLFRELDGDDPANFGGAKEWVGKTASYQFNLLTQELVYEVMEKGEVPRQLVMRTNYNCEERKSLFD